MTCNRPNCSHKKIKVEMLECDLRKTVGDVFEGILKNHLNDTSSKESGK